MADGPAIICGVFCQPVDVKWRGRGINTLVGAQNGPNDPSRAQWRKDARAAGFYYFDWPSSHPADDQNDDHLLAVMLPDEPDDKGVPPQVITDQAKLLKQQTGKPTFLNADGWQMTWRKWDYALGFSAVDYCSIDYYPLNHDGDPAKIADLAARLDDLKTFAPGKRYFAHVECSDQNLRIQPWVKNDPLAQKMRGPTWYEMAAELAVLRGRGVEPIYFPQRIGVNFEAFDSMTPDMVAEMTRQNAALRPRVTTATVSVPGFQAATVQLQPS